jgi:hypothetical protein
MTHLPDAQPGTTKAPEDVQQLLNRIKELEQQLGSRAEGAGGLGHAASSGPLLKVLAAGLAAAAALMALPAFITLRRWYEWWR